MTSNNQRELSAGLQKGIELYQQQRLSDAIVQLNGLAKKFPDSAKAWGYLGFLYREASRLPQALKCFRRTVDLSPSSERASLGLFFTLRRLGKLDEAFKELGRFALHGKPVRYLELVASERIEEEAMPI